MNMERERGQDQARKIARSQRSASLVMAMAKRVLAQLIRLVRLIRTLLWLLWMRDLPG